MMKKIIAGLVVVTIIIAGWVLITGALTEDNSTSTTEPSNNNTNVDNNEVQQETTTSNEPNRTITRAELAEHASKDDCWIIIEQSVYDVTEFAANHPGGEDRITSLCGQDATSAFATQGGEGMHSENAKSVRESFKIGDLAED